MHCLAMHGDCYSCLLLTPPNVIGVGVAFACVPTEEVCKVSVQIKVGLGFMIIFLLRQLLVPS